MHHTKVNLDTLIGMWFLEAMFINWWSVNHYRSMA
jgi:hypothetical protein